MLCFSCFKAREKEKQQGSNEEATTSESTTTTERISDRYRKTAENENTWEMPSIRHFPSFPPLPLPPQDHQYYGHKNQQESITTEDKMGTLYNAIIDVKEQPGQNSSFSQTSSDRDKSTRHRQTTNHTPTVRFVPRKTNLENRKRKTEEAAETSLTHVSGKNEPFIGPKLPELPKLDMEDVSLNTTVSLIRNTMKQVMYIRFCLKQLRTKINQNYIV